MYLFVSGWKTLATYGHKLANFQHYGSSVKIRYSQERINLEDNEYEVYDA